MRRLCRGNGTNGTARYYALLNAEARRILTEALRRHDGNRTYAARDLGLQRTCFLSMLSEQGLQDYSRGGKS